MYVNIAKRIANLAVTPKKEWKAISMENSDQTEVLTKFVLPLLGIGAGLVFVRQLWLPQFSLTLALRLASISFGAMLLGIFSVYWVNRKLLGYRLNETDKNQWFAFAAYASGIYCVAESVVMMFPHLYPLRAAALLSGFAAWHWAQSRASDKIVLSLVTATTVTSLVASGTLGALVAQWLQTPSN